MIVGKNETVSGVNPARVEALDLLRLLAVLAVIAFHYGFQGPTSHGGTDVPLPEIADIAKYGYLGVQLFFVISGFVIAYSSHGLTAADFAIARSVRIYPAFVFCMTVTFIATLALGAPRFEATFEQWAANLFLAAPEFKQPYMDSAYWTLVSEVTFYAWVYVLMLAGAFQRGIDMIVLTWLGLSVMNEVAVGSFTIHKVFLTNQSGFFAAGLLLYEMYKGRRDLIVQGLLGLAAACAVFQGLVNVQELRERFQVEFDGGIVAGLCLAAIMLVMMGARLRRLPLPAEVVVAIGALTYPLYLLHQQIGYIAFKRLAALASPRILFFVIVAALIVGSWATWKYVERPGQRLMKSWLLQLTGRLGLSQQLGWRDSVREIASAGCQLSKLGTDIR